MLVSLEPVSPNNSVIEKYERILGFNSVWLLPSLGTLLQFILVYPLMLIGYFLLFLLKKCFPCLNSLRIWFRDIVFWNWPIKYLNDSFIVIVISCLINIVYGSWETKEAAINTWISWVLLILAVLYAPFMQSFLYSRRASLKKHNFRRKYNGAY